MNRATHLLKSRSSIYRSSSWNSRSNRWTPCSKQTEKPHSCQTKYSKFNKFSCNNLDNRINHCIITHLSLDSRWCSQWARSNSRSNSRSRSSIKETIVSRLNNSSSTPITTWCRWCRWCWWKAIYKVHNKSSMFSNNWTTRDEKTKISWDQINFRCSKSFS